MLYVEMVLYLPEARENSHDVSFCSMRLLKIVASILVTLSSWMIVYLLKYWMFHFSDEALEMMSKRKGKGFYNVSI